MRDLEIRVGKGEELKFGRDRDGWLVDIFQ